MGRVLLGLGVAGLMAGLVMGGADAPVRASLFAVLMSAIAIASSIASPAKDIAAAFGRHALSVVCILAFALWALVMAYLPLPAASAHPLWGELGFQQGYLSLAPHRTLEGLSAFVGAVCAFVLGALLVRTRTDKDVLGLMLCLGGGLFSIAALAYHTQERSEGFGRLAFTLGSANAAALVFTLIALTSFCLTWRLLLRRLANHGPTNPLTLASAAIGLSTLALSLTALLLTASRAGLGAALGGLLLLFALLWHTSLTSARAKIVALAAPLLASSLIIMGAGFALERLGALDAAAAQRSELVSIHWRFFEARPLTGHGLNTFHELHQSALDGANYRDQRAMGSAHNIFVQSLEETGIIGFGLLALALAALGFKLLALIVQRKPGADWASAALASLFVVLAHGAVDFGLQLPAIGAWIALLLGAYSRESRT